MSGRVASRHPPPGGASPSLSKVRVVFLAFPGVNQWRLVVSQLLGLWSFVSPSLVLVVAIALLAFRAMEFLSSFSVVFLVLLVKAALAVGGGSCRSQCLQ